MNLDGSQPTSLWIGYIDEIGIFTAAKPDAQITSIYNNNSVINLLESSGSYSPTKLKHYYRLNNDLGIDYTAAPTNGTFFKNGSGGFSTDHAP